MKKLFALIFVVLLAVGMFAGCGAEAESHDLSSTNLPSETETKIQEEVTQIETVPADVVTIEKKVIYDTDGVTVTVTGIEEGWTGTEIKLLVENATDRNIAVSGDNIIVNGVTMSAYLYIDVAAGKKTNSTMSIYSDNLEAAGIERIATLNAKDAHIVDTDSYETLAAAPFEIVTSIGSDYVQEIDDSGDILFESNGVSVIAKIITDSLFGEEVMLLVKNTSNEDITVEAENISVNGFTVDGWMYDTVYAGTVRFCEMDIYSSSLEENGITEVEDVCFTINLINPNTYSRIAKSDEIQVVVNP